MIYRSYTRLPDAARVRMLRGHRGLGALPARVACSVPGAPRSSATCSRITMTGLSPRIPQGTRRRGLRYGQLAASAPTEWPPQHARRASAGRGATKPSRLGCDRACNATAARGRCCRARRGSAPQWGMRRGVPARRCSISAPLRARARITPMAYLLTQRRSRLSQCQSVWVSCRTRGVQGSEYLCYGGSRGVHNRVDYKASSYRPSLSTSRLFSTLSSLSILTET